MFDRRAYATVLAFGGALIVAFATPGHAAPVGGPSQAEFARAKTHAVAIRDIDFTPSRLSIRAGDRVRWVWHDGPATSHNVVSRGSRRFRSARTRTDGTYTVRFRHKGTYAYVCTIHLGMRAKIIVR